MKASRESYGRGRGRGTPIGHVLSILGLSSLSLAFSSSCCCCACSTLSFSLFLWLSLLFSCVTRTFAPCLPGCVCVSLVSYLFLFACSLLFLRKMRGLSVCQWMACVADGWIDQAHSLAKREEKRREKGERMVVLCSSSSSSVLLAHSTWTVFEWRRDRREYLCSNLTVLCVAGCNPLDRTLFFLSPTLSLLLSHALFFSPSHLHGRLYTCTDRGVWKVTSHPSSLLLLPLLRQQAHEKRSHGKTHSLKWWNRLLADESSHIKRQASQWRHLMSTFQYIQLSSLTR